ncbi:MAG: hypothetical protein WEA10_04670 [Actinomycetota bacterium]
MPSNLRADIAAGYREKRSPDVLVVPHEAVFAGWKEGGQSGVRPLWPSTVGTSSQEVPLLFTGTGIAPGATVPAGTTLDRVAPTLMEILGIEWNNPAVHPGAPLEITASGPPPRLVLVVALEGIGSADVEGEPPRDWTFLRSLLHQGAGTMRADAGSLPLDPAAILTTVGTGGLPADHGITGTFLRDDDAGDLTRAWGRGAPLSVIATFADDLDADEIGFSPVDGQARVGFVADDEANRGLVGGTWYPNSDRDDVVITDPARIVADATALLASGYGTDGEPDVLGVVVRHSAAGMDDQLRHLVEAARTQAGDGLAVVVTATGPAPTTGPPNDEARQPLSEITDPVEAAVPGSSPAIEGTQPGGLFLDQATLTQAGVSSGTVVQALLRTRGADSAPLLADAFGGFAVQFGRFC